MTTRYIHTEGTFNAGRNSQKRAAFQAERNYRREAIAQKAAGDFTVSTAKIKRSKLLVDLLADRRLRQRSQNQAA